MSDEDSFVILGSSPMPSLNDGAVNDGPCSFSSLKNSQILNGTADSLELVRHEAVLNKTPTASMKNDLIEAAGSIVESSCNSATKSTVASTINKETINESSSLAIEIGAEIINNENNVNQNSTPQKDSVQSDASAKSNSASNGSASAPISIGKEPPSLASSFILGEINADVLKASVYSQFPSICSMEACAEDVVKLQTFMTEYLDLKRTLLRVNDTMRQYYNQTKQWKENMQRVENQYKLQIDNCQMQIASLRNQNMELKREVDLQTEQLRVTNEVQQKDNNELILSLSEKSAQINNMRTIIEKLEMQQLSSFEVVPTKSTKIANEPEYVAQLEHQRIITELEGRITILECEKKELQELKPQYIDEITCLKVNLTAAEELINKFRADINLLKAKDIEKSEIFDKYEFERNQMREELTLLRQQVEIYSKDFEIERNSRQQLASEKDDLIQDLRALQRRNQELIEEAEKQLQKYTEHVSGAGAPETKATTAAAAGTSNPIRAQSPSYNDPRRPIRNLTPPGATPSHPPGVGCCPICSKKFPNLNLLQSHASTCINFTD